MSYKETQQSIVSIPETWEVKELHECIDLVIDYRGKTPKKLGADWIENEGYRALSAKNIKNGKIVREDTIRYLSKEVYKKWMKEEVQKYDIILTSEAPLGESLLWDSDEKIVLSQRLYCIRPDTSVIYPKYLYAYFNTKVFLQELNSRATGTTVTGIRQVELLKTKVIIPNYEVQKAIGDFYYNINKKIELNNDMNSTIEEMIHTIYHSWFVNYEFPDQNGSSYKTNGGELIESKLGLIPKGWEIRSIDDLSEIVSKGTTPTKKDVDTAIDSSFVKFIKVKDIDDSGNVSGNLEEIPRSVHEGKLKRSILHEWDILFSIAGTIGRVTYVNKELNDTNINQAIAFIRLKEKVDFGFIYNFLKTNRTQDLINSKVVQAVQANVSLGTLKSLKFVYPGSEILGKFNDIFIPLFLRKENNSSENNQLIILRDYLLPKLVSGEFSINKEKKEGEECLQKSN